MAKEGLVMLGGHVVTNSRRSKSELSNWEGTTRFLLYTQPSCTLQVGWAVEVFGTEGVWIGQGMEEGLVLLGG